MRTAEDRGVVYEITTSDPFDTQDLIAHRITVFEQEENATKFFDEIYEEMLSLTKQNMESQGTAHENFAPPEKYSYESPMADEFKTIYAPEKSLAGPIVGYTYWSWTRYGNVVSEFITIVEDVEQTGIPADEANILPWVEVEGLLGHIDDKFRQVGF